MKLIYLVIEFLDELVFGVTESAWPMIQADLGLSYTQIGIIMTVPGLVSAILEPVIGILGDLWKRRLLILGGGAVFCCALFLTGFSQGFILLIISFSLFYPASGAFVSLAQANLMDLEANRHDQNMARWTFAGSLGVVTGPPLLIGLVAIGFGWRGVYLVLGILAVLLVIFTWIRYPGNEVEGPGFPGLKPIVMGFRNALAACKRNKAVRWLVLLLFSDLMLDVLLGFLALYFHDAAGLTEVQAAGAVLIWLVCGLIGDFLLIPLLEKVDGLRYLRASVMIELVLFPSLLLIHQPWIKLILVGLLGFFNSGWYAILKGRLYTSMEGKSGSVMTLSNLFGLAGGLFPLIIGLVADVKGLEQAMWFLLAGPIALMIGLVNWKKIINNPVNGVNS